MLKENQYARTLNKKKKTICKKIEIASVED